MSVPSSSSLHTVAELGEGEIIRRFLGSTLSKGTIGIGDDCAVTRTEDGFRRLTTTDLFIEHIHFEKDLISPHDVGFKALAVNLSDIAAMGGRPDGFYLSMALPSALPTNWLDSFRDGMMELSRKHEVPLLGGDTTRSAGDIIISITATGVVKYEYLKLRSVAEIHDILCVTGSLGDSVAGLSLLQQSDRYGNLSQEYRCYLIDRHCCPAPAMKEGQWLGRQAGVHAMIDLSDGLLTDARHLADQSQCQIKLLLDQVPLSPAFEAFTEQTDGIEKGQELATVGGEDYRLLVTLANDQFSEIAEQFDRKFGTPLYRVGTVCDGAPSVQTFRNGTEVTIEQEGFKHFNRP